MKRYTLVAILAVLSLLSIAPLAAQDDDDNDAPTIAGIVADNEDFSTLLTALETAEWVEALDGDGPLTVFAPTNEAFEALPEGALDDLLDDPDTLSAILRYHVVEGEVYAEDVLALDGETVETLAELDIAISLGEDEDGETIVLLNETVQVIEADIEAANGVIHVIDAVLTPPADEDSDTMADEDAVEIDFSDPEAVTIGLIEIFFSAETVDDFLPYICEGQEDSDLIPDQTLLESFEGIEVDTSELELTLVENEDGSVNLLPGGNIILIIAGQEQSLPASLLAQQVGLDSIRLVQDDAGNWLACPEE